MAKKINAQVKLQIPAGKATPAPPVGTALGPQGVNIMEFCKAFNAKTSAKDQEGLIIPVVITIFSDRSFTFITKTPPVPVLIKRACGLAKGSPEAILPLCKAVRVDSSAWPLTPEEEQRILADVDALAVKGMRVLALARRELEGVLPETARETEVLRMVAKGMSYKQIADRLVLSHRTVQNHVQNTLRKLQLHNRVELTRYAIEQGLDEDG